MSSVSSVSSLVGFVSSVSSVSRWVASHDLYFIECRVCFGNVGYVGFPPNFFYFTFYYTNFGGNPTYPTSFTFLLSFYFLK